MNSDFQKLPKRILMTADTVGGVWTYALELARSLEPFGVEVLLATMGALPNKKQHEEAPKIRNLSIFKSEYKLEWMENCWHDVKLAGEWLLHLERRLNPDLIHLNGYVHGNLPFSAPKIIVGHSCVLSWWKAVKNENAPEDWNKYKSAVMRGLQSADLVVAPTRAMLDALEKHYGFLRNSRVIANGREASFFQTKKKEKFVLSAGRLWDEAKNIFCLTCAAQNLSHPVFVAGDDRHPNGEVKRFENVKMLGRLAPKKLVDWYSRAAIYALPARYEPFGLSALEAALSGCALILGDIPSLREVWGEAAIYVAPNDSQELYETLENLLADDAKREKMAQLARARALQFSPAKMAENYFNVYSELLNDSSKSREKTEAFACAS